MQFLKASQFADINNYSDLITFGKFLFQSQSAMLILCDKV